MKVSNIRICAIVFLILLSSCSGEVRVRVKGEDAQLGTAYIASQIKCPEGFYLKKRRTMKIAPYRDLYQFYFECVQTKTKVQVW